MSNSTHIITDITTVITNGPQGLTQALSIVASGQIMDYPGNCNLLLTKFQEAQLLITAVMGDTDQTQDATNYALLLGIQNDLT